MTSILIKCMLFDYRGTHADLLVIVFHKVGTAKYHNMTYNNQIPNQITITYLLFFQIITTGHQRLQPLFDCLLTILCNVSPYIKSLSMMASCKLLHLLEAFSTPWFLFSNPSNHHLGLYTSTFSTQSGPENLKSPGLKNS